jgi:hypothetical protein
MKRKQPSASQQSDTVSHFSHEQKRKHSTPQGVGKDHKKMRQRGTQQFRWCAAGAEHRQ